MPSDVALLRGIHIGTKKRTKMDALRAWMKSLGYANDRTCVTSGNVLLYGFDRAPQATSTSPNWNTVVKPASVSSE